MSGAFLMAEVPYGGNGFTLLLSSVSRQRRTLAEAAQNAVPRSGSGAEGTNIFVCRDVSQGDTGRQGSARLVLANVSLSQLDSQRLERLQWKLERFLDSLDTLLPDIPQATGRDCGPVVSVALREWEEELKVAQLPAATELLDATYGAVRTEPYRVRKYAAIVIVVFCLLGYWTAQRGSQPADVAAERGDAATVVQAESDTPDRGQQSGSQQIGEFGPRDDRRPDAPSKKRKKVLSDLLDEWRTQTVTVEEALEKLDAAWSVRNETERQSVSGQEIAGWLGSLWWQEPAADGRSDLEAEWQAAASKLTRLGEVANLQSFSGASGVASKIPAVRARFHQDVVRALQEARGSRLIMHSTQIFQYGGLSANSLKDMIRIDVAVANKPAVTDVEEPARESWRQVRTAASLDGAFNALQGLCSENPETLHRSLVEFQLLLTALDELLGAELLLTIHTEKSNTFGSIQQVDSAEQAFSVLDLLHRETLETEVGEREYLLGGEKRAREFSAREYWRSLLTQGDGTRNNPSRVKITNFRKENRDPVDVVTLELQRGRGPNEDWFRSRDEFRKRLKSFDASLQEAKSTVLGDVTMK